LAVLYVAVSSSKMMAFRIRAPRMVPPVRLLGVVGYDADCVSQGFLGDALVRTDLAHDGLGEVLGCDPEM
jgi:hypothetical protein